MDLLAQFQKEPLPFAKLLGIELRSVAPDRIVAEMTVREDLCTRPAVLHGGAIMAFADTLGALGTIANLAQTAPSPSGAPGTVTIESKTNFVGPPLSVRASPAKPRPYTSGAARWSGRRALRLRTESSLRSQRRRNSFCRPRNSTVSRALLPRQRSRRVSKRRQAPIVPGECSF